MNAAADPSAHNRRLVDETERARKTVSARVRDAVLKLDHINPELAQHLHRALRMGSTCSYTPIEPTTWKVDPS